MSRLIVLGAVRTFQPVHGYDLRRELEGWRVAEWANLSYGSIYFHLKSLAEVGLLEEVGTDQVGKRPARTTYRLTAGGEAEFQQLLRSSWWEYERAIDPFSAALAFMRILPRDELIAALEHRARVLRSGARGMEFAARRSSTIPMRRTSPKHSGSWPPDGRRGDVGRPGDRPRQAGPATLGRQPRRDALTGTIPRASRAVD